MTSLQSHLSGAALRPSAGEQARGVLEQLRTSRDRRMRRIPAFDVLPASGRPTIYYLMPSADRPQGGVRVAYRHVDLLNEMGRPAAILHPKEGFRAQWFESSTPVVGPRSMRFREDDILVVPEWFGPSLAALDARTRVLVFNQGAYITYDGLPPVGAEGGAPYAGIRRLEGIMTVSADSAEILRLGFPDVPVDVVRPALDATVFSPGRSPAQRRLAYVPSRRRAELNLLQHLLRAVGVDWEFLAISGMSEQEVAHAMQSSAIFLSLSERDGFGLPPAEAMACGAYVVGYPGGGGEEFFDPAYCTPVRNVAEFVRAVKAATARPLEELAERGRAASRSIHGYYNEDGLRADLRKVFDRVLG